MRKFLSVATLANSAGPYNTNSNFLVFRAQKMGKMLTRLMRGNEEISEPRRMSMAPPRNSRTLPDTLSPTPIPITSVSSKIIRVVQTAIRFMSATTLQEMDTRPSVCRNLTPMLSASIRRITVDRALEDTLPRKTANPIV